METSPNSKQPVACIDPSFNSSLASHVKGLEIYARWDGIQEHPVAVSILFTVKTSHQYSHIAYADLGRSKPSHIRSCSSSKRETLR